MLTEPSVGAVYVCNNRRPNPSDRYIILDASEYTEGRWRLRLVRVDNGHIYPHHDFESNRNDDKFITFEPLADGEEVLFFQAMLAPHTLKELPR